MSLTMLRSQLTEDDIRRLAKSDDPKGRAQAAQKICLRIGDAGFTAEERAAANDILRLMAADAAAMVRRALVTTLKNSPHLAARQAAQSFIRNQRDQPFTDRCGQNAAVNHSVGHRFTVAEPRQSATENSLVEIGALVAHERSHRALSSALDNFGGNALRYDFTSRDRRLL